MKDFSCRLPIFRQGTKRKRAPQRHSLLAARTHSIDQPRLSLLNPIKSRRLSDFRGQAIQSSVDQIESRLDMVREQRHRGVGWIPEENFPSSSALSSDQFQRQLTHDWCPIREVGHDQPRLSALLIVNNCSRAAGVLKELPSPSS